MRPGTIYKVILFVLIAVITGIYFFIPASIRVSKEIKLSGFDKTIFMLLSYRSHWEDWEQKSFTREDYSFDIIRSSYPIVIAGAKKNAHKIPIEIEIISIENTDSCYLSWHYEQPGGFTPWSRIKGYFEARKLKYVFSKKMEMLATFAGKTENLYGIPIVQSKVKDTIVATLTTYESKPPTGSLICYLISTLRQLLNHNKLIIIDSPMAIKPINEEGKFKVMVGFPIYKILEPSIGFNFKKMIPGKLLTGTVLGGAESINNGYAQMNKYITDHYIEVAALPYEVIVTNRCTEKDTARWVTRICFPVF